MNFIVKQQLFKNFLAEWDSKFRKLPHLAKIFTSFPSFQKKLDETPLIESKELNESQLEWISLVAQFDNPLEKEFFKPYWVPVSKNVYEYFVDLSSNAFSVFKIKYLCSGNQRWAIEEVIPDISEFILALENKTISFDDILYDDCGNPLDENGEPVISDSPPDFIDIHTLHATFKGYDLASIDEDDVAVYGYFLQSPLEERMISMFNYVPVDDNSAKPYQASWMISEKKLILLHVNATINGQELTSYEIVPEYTGDYEDEPFLFSTSFGNRITFIIEEIENQGYSASIYSVGDRLSLDFCDGILVNVEVNK